MKQIRETGLKYAEKYWHIAVILAITALLTLWNYNFIENDRSPLVGDSISHINLSLNMYDCLKNMKTVESFFAFARLPYPPFMYYYASAVFFVFGVSLKNLLWSLFPFTLIMLFCTYGIAARLGGRLAGVIAFVVAAGSSFIMNNMHVFLIDYPQSAFSLLSIYFLLKSDKFEKPLPSYLFGIAAGLSLFCKFNALFIILAPVLVVWLYFLKRGAFSAVYSSVCLAAIAGTGLLFLSGIIRNFTSQDYESMFLRDITLLLVLAAAIIVVSIVILKKKASDKPFCENFRPVFRFIISILIAFSISMPYYLYSRWLLFSNFRGHGNQNSILTFGFIKEQLLGNLGMINTLFPLVMVFVIVGLVLFILKKENLWEYMIVFAAGFSGIFLTSALASSQHRFLISSGLIVAILSVLWVKFTGRYKPAAASLILVWPLMCLVYPFVIKSIPVRQEEVLNPGERGIVFFYPAFPAQPQPDFWSVYAISEAVVDHCFQNSDKKTSSVGIMVMESSLFEENENAFNGDRQGYREFLYFNVTPGLCRYMLNRSKGQVLCYADKNQDPEKVLLSEPKRQFYLIDCYDARESRDEAAACIARNSERKLHFVKGFNLGGSKLIDIWVFEAGK
ncbi:MAG: glycosyltransferase family 39 protein [Firmicutes bacterium]|nr:glycosyltransferase family 39 protein [Bacillota bacterium]